MKLNMKLEQQVVSLELAKKLKELGVPQKENMFVWSNQAYAEQWRVEHRQFFAADMRRDYAAYTVAELGEMLPNETRDRLGFFSGLAINGWFCEVKNYRVMPFERLHVELQHDTEANARAAMLIYLIENKLVDVKTLSVTGVE